MSTNLEAENNNDAGSQPESGAQKDAKGQAKGGKKNKQKGKTMSLAAFNAHAEQHTVANWADHVETVVNTRQSTQPSGAWQPKQSSKYVEPESAYDLDVDPIRSQLPTAPRAAREAPVVDLSRIPEDGPFKVHVGNLPFDVTEQAVASFFGAQEKQVNLIREGGRPKGFGFVELTSRELLIEALGKNGESMRGRAIKVALATAPAGSENERHRDRDDRSNRGWRNTDAPPREEVERNWRERRDDRGPERRFDDRERYGDDRERRFDDRDRDRDRRYDGGRRFGDRERRFDDRERRFDDRERRFDDRERRFDDRDRRFDDRRRFDRERDDEPRVEESNWRRGLAQRKPEERDADGAERPADSEPRREFSPEAARRDREPERERDRDREPEREREREPEREREREREPERERERESERDRDSEQKPRERPKLNLQPRTKPLGEVGVQSGISEATRKAIFGGAKPVDTVAREREIEQRLDAEREKFEHAHELDEAVANRTRRRTVSSSSNTSNRRYDEPPARLDDAPATDRERERLNSVRSNASRLAEEEELDTQREKPNYRAERADRPERTWYRGGAPRGRFQRPAPQSDRRPPSDRPQGDDEYFYDDDFRSDRPQPEADDETPTYYGSAAHRQAPPRGAGRFGSRPGRPPRASHDTPDEDGFQQVGAGGRAVPGGSGSHRPPEYPGGKPTSGTAAPKRPEIVKKDKEEAPPMPATLIHKSKFSALDEDAPDEE